MTEVGSFFRAPTAEVFAYLADPRNRPQWQSSLRAVEMIDDGEVAAGMRWRDITAIPGVRPTMVITECTPYRVWSERGTWGGVSADLCLRFTQTKQGTKVLAHVAVTAQGPWRLAGGLALRLAPTALKADLDRAAVIVAARSQR